MTIININNISNSDQLLYNDITIEIRSRLSQTLQVILKMDKTSSRFIIDSRGFPCDVTIDTVGYCNLGIISVVTNILPSNIQEVKASINSLMAFLVDIVMKINQRFNGSFKAIAGSREHAKSYGKHHPTKMFLYPIYCAILHQSRENLNPEIDFDFLTRMMV